MTREERVAICRKCQNRKLDTGKGLICSLTGDVAAFDETCPSFVLDETVKDIEHNEEFISKEDHVVISPEIKDKLRLEQSLPKAILAGSVIAVGCAVVWALLTLATDHIFGLAAIAVGFAVGFGVRVAGKGVDTIFGITGALLAFLGCALGNFLSIIGYVANEFEMSFFDVLPMISFPGVFNIMVENMGFMDVLFYGFAIYEGYRFSFRRLTKADISVAN